MFPLLATATRKELDAAAPELSGMDIPEHAAVPVALRDRPWLVCLTGVGPINAALALGTILTRHPDIPGVLNLGLAGSFDLDAAPLGACVRVTEELWPEYGLADDTGTDAAALGFPLWERDGAPVWDRLPLPDALEALGLRTPPEVRQGPSLTVAGVTNSRERACRLHRRYAPLLENMEGFAVALACARQGVSCVELRTVSNRVGSRAPEDRAFGAALAGLKTLCDHCFL